MKVPRHDGIEIERLSQSKKTAKGICARRDKTAIEAHESGRHVQDRESIAWQHGSRYEGGYAGNGGWRELDLRDHRVPGEGKSFHKQTVSRSSGRFGKGW